MRTRGNGAAPADAELTAEEQAALAAQQAQPPDPEPQEPAQDADQGVAPPVDAGAEGAPEGTEGGEADSQPKMVKLEALQEARAETKALKREFAEEKRRYEERFNQLLAKVGQQAQPQPHAQQPPAIPDFQADPAGHIVGTMQQQGASIAQINQALQSLAAQQQQAQAVSTVQQRALALESDFRGSTPDYDAAVNHLREFRNKQLEALGWSDPARRHQQIMQEALGIAHEAMSNGRNPAEVLYQMAKVSGYAPVPPAQATPAPAAGNGAAAVPDAAQKLETVRRGQEQARGLSGVRGSGPGPWTLDKIMELPPDKLLELAKANNGEPPPDVKRFFGA